MPAVILLGAYTDIDNPFLLVLLFGAVILNVLFGRRGLLNGFGIGDGDGFADASFWTPMPRPSSKLPPRPRLSQAPRAAMLRQPLDDSTGELTTQDLDEGAVVPQAAASAAHGGPLTEEEELALLRERRWKVRQNLPQINQELLGLWRQLAAALRRLPEAAEAQPGSWELPPELRADAFNVGQPGSDAVWNSGAGAGPLAVTPASVAAAPFTDLNHNGIPDHLEGGDWAPLSFSERAFRGVLEAEAGPGVLLTAIRSRLSDLYLSQALMGFALRLQGPIEEVRTVVLRAFAACDERVPALKRQQLRAAVLEFVDQDLPRMNGNLERAAGEIERD